MTILLIAEVRKAITLPSSGQKINYNIFIIMRSDFAWTKCGLPFYHDHSKIVENHQFFAK
jgi:hypothetical protein